VVAWPTSAVAHLELLAVQPQVRLGPLERPLAESLHLHIERATERRDALVRRPCRPSCSTRRSTLRVETALT
jgi:hypothetical protein